MAAVTDFVLRPFITAVRTLTILPLPGRDTDRFPRTLVFFPLVGALLAVIVFAVFAAGRTLFPEHNALTALLMFAGMALFTGALHLDGLADVADGFGGGRTPERSLEIMKDPRKGTFGVLALIIDSLLKISLYSILIEEGRVIVIVLSLVLSRAIQTPVIAFLPYARKEGGTAQNFCNDPAGRPGALVALVAIMAVLFLFLPPISAGICFLVPVCACGLFAWYCLFRISGITGDCIGAVNEIAEITFLLTAAALAGMGL